MQKGALRLRESMCSVRSNSQGLTGGLGIGFGEGFTGEPETVYGSGDTAINADLKQYFAYLLTTQAVTQGAAHMQLEFVRPVEGRDHRQVDHAAFLERQTLTAPDMTPAILGDHFLQWPGEIVGVLDGTIDVGFAQHLGADLQAFFVFFVVHSDCLL